MEVAYSTISTVLQCLLILSVVACGWAIVQPLKEIGSAQWRIGFFFIRLAGILVFNFVLIALLLLVLRSVAWLFAGITGWHMLMSYFFAEVICAAAICALAARWPLASWKVSLAVSWILGAPALVAATYFWIFLAYHDCHSADHRQPLCSIFSDAPF